MAGTDTILSSHKGKVYIGTDTTTPTITLPTTPDNDDRGKVTSALIASFIASDGDAKEIINLVDIGMPLSWEKNRIDLPYYGDTTASALVGQKNAGEFTFSFIVKFDDDTHKIIMDAEATKDNIDADDGILRGFVIEFTQSATKKSYIYFTGYLQSVQVSASEGDTVKADVTVAVSGRRATVAMA